MESYHFGPQSSPQKQSFPPVSSQAMKLRLSTPVAQDYNQVFDQFDQRLLKKLTPPGMKLKAIQFDGSEKGDVVHLEVTILGLIKQEWYNVITESGRNEKRNYFVDEGVRLPGMFKYWRHEHSIEKNGDSAVIVDNITYKSPFFLLDWLLWPTVLLQFAYRKPIYKKFFA